jgi:magnesium transporter
MDSFAMGPLQGQYAIPDNHEGSLQHPDTHTDSDIYRGSSLQYRVPEEFAVDRVSTSNITISSATSASTDLVRRAIATAVELALVRWTRSSSSSSNSSSLAYLHNGSTRRQNSRQRQHRHGISTAVVDTTYIAHAREAAEHARRVPREFHLVLPVFQPPLHAESPHRILQTSSLSLVLAQLTITLRRAHRARRDKMPRHSRAPTQLSNVPLPRSVTRDSDSPTDTPGLQTDISTEQGQHRSHSKQTQTILRPSIGTPSWQAGGSAVGQRAWWLDVASPTWEDMRAIGTVNLKVFHALLKCLIRTRHL